jgi:hypothetical protein
VEAGGELHEGGEDEFLGLGFGDDVAQHLLEQTDDVVFRHGYGVVLLHNHRGGHQQISELAQAPHSHLHQRLPPHHHHHPIEEPREMRHRHTTHATRHTRYLLLRLVGEREVELAYCIGVELGRRGDESDQRRLYSLGDVMARQRHHPQHRVNAPLGRRRVALRDGADLGCQVGSQLVIGHRQEIGHLPHERSHVLGVHQHVDQLQRPVSPTDHTDRSIDR